MKNINYVINGVLAVAVVILYIMQFSGKKESSVTRTFASAGDTTALLPIAYVNVDSLLLNYNYSKDLNEIILKKQENSRANITQKARSLQGEMQDFQRKVENNAFLTRERAEQEQQRLLNKQQELQNLDNQLAQELMQEQQKLNEQLRDTVVSQLKAFNLGRGYQVVFSNTVGDNILLAGDSYDITGELLEYLKRKGVSKERLIHPFLTVLTGDFIEDILYLQSNIYCVGLVSIYSSVETAFCGQLLFRSNESGIYL